MDDPTIELCFAGIHHYFDLFAERRREIARVFCEPPEKRLQRLNLEIENGIELAVGEPAKNPLSSFQVHSYLAQRGRERGQNLPGSPFTDPSLSQGGESEDPIGETFGSHRHDPHPRPSFGEIVDNFRSHPHLLAGSSPTTLPTAHRDAPIDPCIGLFDAIGGKCLQISTNVAHSVFEIVPRTSVLRVNGVLDLVTQLGHGLQTHHPAGSLEGVELAAKLCPRILVLERGRRQLLEAFDAICRLLEKEGHQVVVMRCQILVQLKRLTSTPSVPTISSARSWIATAIVKQGSPVSSES